LALGLDFGMRALWYRLQATCSKTKVPIVNKPLSDDKLSYLVTEDCQDELVDNVSSPLIESRH